MAIPNIRNRHSVAIKSQLLTGVGKAGAEDDLLDAKDFARDTEDDESGFDDMPQFNT
jgi:hypothetical protein